MSRVIGLSEATIIGLHGMVMVAAGRGKALKAVEIAQKLEVSDHHLAKVMQRFVKVGLLSSVRGPRGGFVLAKPASEITLFQVYDLIEGKPDLDPCFLHRGECVFMECLFGGWVDKVNKEFLSILTNKTLEDCILPMEKCKGENPCCDGKIPCFPKI